MSALYEDTAVADAARQHDDGLAPARDRAPAAQRQALRFLTAGSVDDGKSTLIGRLLYDSRAILADQLDMLQAQVRRRHARSFAADRRPGSRTRAGHHHRRRAPLLRHARAQVHHRRRAGPRAVHAQHGHRRRRQRRRVVLVDTTKIDWRARPVALLPQTRRHALLAHLLRVPSIVFAVNKIDALADPQSAFEAVRDALQEFAFDAGIEVAAIVPLSALRGDNVTLPLDAPWYRGPSRCCSCCIACRPRKSGAKARCCCRCSTWRAKPARSPKAPATSRARCGAASPRAACASAMRSSCFPAASAPP
jgi:sulfate adenylyltransferase subunit 1